MLAVLATCPDTPWLTLWERWRAQLFPWLLDTQSISCGSRCLCRGNITDSNWFISVCYGNPHGNSPLNNYIFKLLARIYFALSAGTVDMIAHCYKWHIVSTRRERHCLHWASCGESVQCKVIYSNKPHLFCLAFKLRERGRERGEHKKKKSHFKSYPPSYLYLFSCF